VRGMGKKQRGIGEEEQGYRDKIKVKKAMLFLKTSFC
jgi:hypothetical protein